MRLGQARDGDVVRNARNGSFYRFARPERGRARIRPLELFPNGRLMPKPADTLVDAGLQVLLIGPWSEGMAAEGAPTRPRAHYERELGEQRERLAALEEAYAALPAHGVGKLSRGSWACKLKSCRERIETLEAGLAEPQEGVEALRAEPEAPAPRVRARDVVLLPSGAPGLVLRTGLTAGGQPCAMVRAHSGSATAPRVEAPIPVALLRPWSDSQLCTL